MANKSDRAIIIKKVKKGDHGGSHSSAWKLAYADFVTAMMAFFLLLWLLNVTTDVQKRGIANYFDPTITSESHSGAGGILGGQTVGSPGSSMVSLAMPSFLVARSAPSQPNEQHDSYSGGASGNDHEQSGAAGKNGNKTAQVQAAGPAKLTKEELRKAFAERQQQNFLEAKKALEQAVEEVPALHSLAKNLMIDETSQGLRIQLVDQAKSPMFPLGSAEMLDPAKKLVALVAQVIMRLPNKIVITGHTDSTQYALSARYTNWELSADRANDCRRELVADGVPVSRVARVVGVADTEPLDKTNPADPRNRRISIVLLRQTYDAEASAGAKPATSGAKVAAATRPGPGAETPPASETKTAPSPASAPAPASRPAAAGSRTSAASSTP